MSDTFDPWITVRVNGEVCCSLPTERSSPAGAVSKVRSTVFGSSRRFTVLDRPSAVAVSSSSR